MFPILSTGVVNSVFFGVYGNIMRSIQMRRHCDETVKHNVDMINVRFCCDADRSNKYWHFDMFVSGCVAGVFFSIINTPSEVVKTMLQASSKVLFEWRLQWRNSGARTWWERRSIFYRINYRFVQLYSFK